MPKAVTKTCLICKVEYKPKQAATQKYCGRSCKEKARSIKLISEGVPRKGGYSRSVYIRVWMKARGETDYTAPCSWCGKLLKADEPFNLAHTVPRGELTFDQIKSEQFLKLSCPECNQAMGTMTEEEFTGKK
jgi:hypothetical protein